MLPIAKKPIMLSVVMPSVVMPSVVMPSVSMPSVVMPSVAVARVAAPRKKFLPEKNSWKVTNEKDENNSHEDESQVVLLRKLL